MSGFLASTAQDCDTLNKSVPLHFTVPPSRNLICLLCQQVFDDPVISECGHTFCRRCISSNHSSRCPIHCERPLTAVVDNLAVHEQIDELFIKCKYGSTYSSELHSWLTNDDGCQAVIKVLDKLAHESQCDFRLMQCPNCLDGSKIRFKDLPTHLRGCQRLRCTHQQYGCPFIGNEDQLQVHLSTECKFEPLKEFLRSTEEKFQEQTEQLQIKDGEIGFLRSVITKLSERVDDIELKFESLQECSARTDLDLVDLRRDVEELIEDFQLSKTSQPPVQQPSREFKCIGTFVGHEGPVWCLAGHRENVYSGSSDATIKVWDVVSSFECIKTLEGHEGIVLSLCIFDNKLYSGSSDCCFNVWGLETYSLLRRVQAHDQAVCTMTTWNGKLITGSLKSIKVWDVNNSCSLLKELSGLNHWVRALLVSESLLYSGSHQAVMVWNLEDYQCLKTIETTGGNVYGLYHYENLLFCAVSENVIHVINLSSDRVVTLKGHEGTVYCVTILENFNNGSAVLLSSSYDKSIRVWNLKTNNCLHTLVKHQGSVSCLLVHNNRVYSGAVDSCIKVWC